ncbi:MAG TPA: hypothetical protein VM238_22495 [Phycisphaerae bacterium]|nr:hypothetical protein [Phycisphaerae bacterium]
MAEKRPKLCPVCWKKYHELRFVNEGNLFYVHFEGDIDGVPNLIGCIITDNSTINGVSFRRDSLPDPGP